MRRPQSGKSYLCNSFQFNSMYDILNISLHTVVSSVDILRWPIVLSGIPMREEAVIVFTAKKRHLKAVGYFTINTFFSK